MKLTLTNQGVVSVPIMSQDEGGWGDVLVPMVQLSINRPGSSNWVIGEKPSLFDEIAKSLEVIVEYVARWREKSKKAGTESLVTVLVQNDGTKPVNVIMGDSEDMKVIYPHDRFTASSKEYIEIRELIELS